MSNFVLFDDIDIRRHLLPLTYYRSIAGIRSGILTLKEKWEKFIDGKAGILTEDYLMSLYPGNLETDLFIASHFYPDKNLTEFIINNLQHGETLVDAEGEIIAFKTQNNNGQIKLNELEKIIPTQTKIYPGKVEKLTRHYQLVLNNALQIEKDIALLDLTPTDKKNYKSTGAHFLYLSEEKNYPEVFFDLTDGPVYIDHGVNILPFSFIKGPAAIMSNSVVKAGTRIYNGTTIGPETKVGGEIKNSLFLGFSNKGHDGYLGDSVIGEWCNLGAGTSNSNLKNNYSSVKIWNFARKDFEDTGLMFLGMIMGDHSKTAINTSVNTGTVIGVHANIFTRDFPPKFIPSFNWGGNHFNHNYDLEKALETAKTVYKRRKQIFSPKLEPIMLEVYNRTKQE